ncbi:unnamed protein product [Vitrella brassicaformis CCMP3155]|uniref:Uncharacterized protein n=1 Tax=Vitrella brassicaformis (strain CCMP3155) TaxID=1169540 RepID=A0A0G4G4S6_VITBC|nr:unnamed protein product [Vitrella brassicaformis CCMP3155]|eukprot:CEM23418.1 unnamed protein product [Vitrella brassicaformis CCMP3155]
MRCKMSTDRRKRKGAKSFRLGENLERSTRAQGEKPDCRLSVGDAQEKRAANSKLVVDKLKEGARSESLAMIQERARMRTRLPRSSFRPFTSIRPNCTARVTFCRAHTRGCLHVGDPYECGALCAALAVLSGASFELTQTRTLRRRA